MLQQNTIWYGREEFVTSITNLKFLQILCDRSLLNNGHQLILVFIVLTCESYSLPVVSQQVSLQCLVQDVQVNQQVTVTLSEAHQDYLWFETYE